MRKTLEVERVDGELLARASVACTIYIGTNSTREILGLSAPQSVLTSIMSLHDYDLLHGVIPQPTHLGRPCLFNSSATFDWLLSGKKSCCTSNGTDSSLGESAQFQLPHAVDDTYERRWLALYVGGEYLNSLAYCMQAFNCPLPGRPNFFVRNIYVRQVSIQQCTTVSGS